MKFGAIIFLVVTTMALPDFLSYAQTLVASFQQPLMNFIDNPLRKSTIPQFILDAGNPWILANQRKLERLPNAEAFLCSLPSVDSKSPESSYLEKFEIPPDVFDYLEIDNNRGEILRPGWPNALERLAEMRRCPRALKQVKKLHVDIWPHYGEYAPAYFRVLEPSQPPERLLTLFGDVLDAMTSLQTLTWNLRKEDTHFFEESFTARNLTLPSIKRLEPGPSSQYLVGMCPNLESLENGGSWTWYHGYRPDGRDWRLMLIEAAVSTPKLKRFAMVGGHAGWTPQLVSEVVKYMPQIESLGVLGSLGEEMEYSGHDTGDSGRLQGILNELTGLENLTHLDLPYSSRLGVGFDGGPGCGNAYFGKEGRRYRRHVMKQGAEATEVAGEIVVKSLPHLNGFTIGSEEANLTRTEDGTFSVTWPWTGRMREWLIDEVPLEDGEDFTDADMENGAGVGIEEDLGDVDLEMYGVDDDGVEDVEEEGPHFDGL